MPCLNAVRALTARGVCRLNEGDGWERNAGKVKVLSLNAATTPIPLPDKSCSRIFSSHMLEHLGP